MDPDTFLSLPPRLNRPRHRPRPATGLVSPQPRPREQAEQASQTPELPENPEDNLDLERSERAQDQASSDKGASRQRRVRFDDEENKDQQEQEQDEREQQEQQEQQDDEQDEVEESEVAPNSEAAYIRDMLTVLEAIRQKLCGAGLKIPVDCPIIEDNTPGHLGVCKSLHQQLEFVGLEKKVYRVNKTQYIGIRFKSENTSRLFPPKNIVATFLHELAHCLAPGVFVKRPTKKENRSQWVFNSHNDEFYMCFADVLRKSEELKIFTMQKTPFKLTRRSLFRFDAIDPDVSDLSDARSPSISKAIYGATLGDLGTELGIEDLGAVLPFLPRTQVSINSPLRLEVIASKKKQQLRKMFILQRRTIEMLHSELSKKFNIKIKKVVTLQGELLDTDVKLLQTKDGTIVQAS